MQSAVDNYLEGLRVRHYSPETVKGRRLSLARFLRHLESIGVTDLREVSRGTIADYQREVLRELATGTARFHMGTLRYFFDYLENTDAILLTPCLSVPLPKMERQLPRHILKHSEVRKMLAAPDTSTPTGIRDRAMLELIYSSGIRRQEIGLLTLPDVDIKNGFVRITRGKGGKDRMVPIGQSACAALARYLAQARGLWLKAERNPGRTDALWLSAIEPHQPVKITAIAQIIERHALRVLGRKASPHVWRHSCATHLVANGANIVYVQRLLGHKSLTTTQIYTRVSAGDLKKTLHRAHPRAKVRADAAPAGHSLESYANRITPL